MSVSGIWTVDGSKFVKRVMGHYTLTYVAQWWQLTVVDHWLHCNTNVVLYGPNTNHLDVDHLSTSQVNPFVTKEESVSNPRLGYIRLCVHYNA